MRTDAAYSPLIENQQELAFLVDNKLELWIKLQTREN